MNKPWKDIESNKKKAKVKYAICGFCGWNSMKLDKDKIIKKQRGIKLSGIKEEKKEFYKCEKCGRLCAILKKNDTQYEIDKVLSRQDRDDLREKKQQDFIERKNKFIKTLSDKVENEDRID